MPEAARKGDPTSHGGVITQGEETVRIVGQFAARVGDDHKCPMSDGNKPHEGGPVGPTGSQTVKICGRFAARVGDPAVCKGAPDKILKGANTVIIGD